MSEPRIDTFFGPGTLPALRLAGRGYRFATIAVIKMLIPARISRAGSIRLQASPKRKVTATISRTKPHTRSLVDELLRRP